MTSSGMFETGALKRMSPELARKLEERDRLYKELDRSLALQELWPDVFMCGPVMPRVDGSFHRGFKYTLTRDDGVSRTFKLLDVPHALWPKKLGADIDAYWRKRR